MKSIAAAALALLLAAGCGQKDAGEPAATGSASTEACNAAYDRLVAMREKSLARFAKADVPSSSTYAELTRLYGKPDAVIEGRYGPQRQAVEWLLGPVSSREDNNERCAMSGVEVADPVGALQVIFLSPAGEPLTGEKRACQTSIRYGFPGKIDGMSLGGDLEALHADLKAKGATETDEREVLKLGDRQYLVSMHGAVEPTDNKVGRIEIIDPGCQ